MTFPWHFFMFSLLPMFLLNSSLSTTIFFSHSLFNFLKIVVHKINLHSHLISITLKSAHDFMAVPTEPVFQGSVPRSWV